MGAETDSRTNSMVLPSVMSHSRPIGVQMPGFILILVDQSSSMSEASGSDQPGSAPSKAHIAAAAVNRVIYDIQESCQAGAVTKDRCVVGVITYGKSVEPVIGGFISKIKTSYIDTEADPESGRELPVWVKADASGGTPMDIAFNDAYALASGWLADHMHCFPPVVI